MARNYRANGSAAYDIYQETSARPLVRPQRLPDAPVRFPPVKKVKAKLSVAPLTVLGIIAVAVMCFVLIHSLASLYEAESQTEELRQEGSALLAEQKDLLLRYENALDLGQVEKRATELGMGLPSAQQIVYIHVDGTAQQEELRSFGQFFEEFIAQLGQNAAYFP